MTTDLYDQCRRMLRRSRVDEDDFTKWELAELARDLPHADPDREEMLAISAYLLEIERRIANRQIAFSGRMQRAIEANDYTVKFPYARPTPTSETAEGHLFIATAWSRPGLVKLCATYFHLSVRVDRYAERYGYPLETFWSARIRRPYCFLAEMRPTLAHLLAKDVVCRDTGEWYRVNAEDLRMLVEQQLEGW